MTDFEEYLIDRGYVKYILNMKTYKYEIANGHTLSSMENMDHRYLPKTDLNIINKIEQGKLLSDGGITSEDLMSEIIFGLNEHAKPPTLIHPRPRMMIIDTKGKIDYMDSDDNMNIVLSKCKFEDIFKAMFDRSIILKIHITDGK